ncbi:malic enzyme-like NAD(P)-binding protein [Helicobacter sp. 11S03491-1]|uniref:malic enzyme-like NAD(P)-binding protein n=1 Tax=Helicobacter sp. 11S03491-1 TaxID=1476196 RepID=UPI000BA638C5|nr:malic enzyme-like NAD(P)-binding protein [Helicobacter sp. 11S03491-1]PAF41089.1 malate dehydrogenase [Helicobacter sp. 11S03491-1]
MDQKLQDQYQKALEYHKGGKLKIEPKTALKNQDDLSLAYSPGVAIPCKEIQKDPLKAYDYTSKCNLVAVISNGTSVLGLGDIGAQASKPVMEGKAILFKSFAGVDAFDIEVNEKNIDKFVAIVKAISPTFGGINLEDIKAPECFEIEERLVKELDIPVMHDDQHGTAIISTAAIINAAKIINKPTQSMRVVISGAGAAAIACAKMYKALGVKEIIMFDSRGVIHEGRSDLSALKKEFATNKAYASYKEALNGSDVFLGLSKADLLQGEDIMGMNKDPLIFAMSNPVPEILPEVVAQVRKDAIMATGRSDYPNQINNVLGFPYIFKGAMSVRAKKINEEMKFAAANALAELAREPIEPRLEEIHNRKLSFGREYLVPSPFDSRLKEKISKAVADAAIQSGVAQI